MITILLVFAVYLQVLSESLPESSSTTPVMANFFIIVMGESACLLIATSFILHIHFKGMQKGCAPIPGWAKQLFLVYGARLVFVNGCGRKAGQSRRKSTICSFDRYFVPPGDQESDVGCSPRIDQRYQLEEFPNNQIERDTGYYHNNNSNNNNSHNINSGQDAVISEVKVIKELICEMSRQDDIEEEYHILARVLNRLCFVVFLITYVVSSCTMLLPAYIEHLHMHVKPRGSSHEFHEEG